MGWSARAGLVVAVVVPAVVFLAQARAFRAANSITYDETFYLNAAKAIFRRGDFDRCAQHGVAPLPVLLEYGPAVWAHGDRIADFAWAATPDDPTAITLARTTSALVIGLPLLALVVGWAFRQTRSVPAALAAGTIVALSPMTTAHLALATTDGCFTVFFLAATLAIGRHASVPSRGRFFAAGGLVGLAVASKYTGLVLLPIGYLIGAVADGRGMPDPRRRLTRLATVHPVRQLGLGVAAVVVAWAVTGFEFTRTPLSANPAAGVPAGTGARRVLGDGPAADAVIDQAHRLRLPSPLVGVYRQFAMASGGGQPVFPTHLFGQVYPSGHRLYYASAVLLKSTPVELLFLGIVAVGAWFWAARRAEVGVSWVAVGAGVGLLFVLFSLSSKQFGLRYLLPLYPVLAVAGVTGLHRFAPRPVLFGSLLAGLVGWQAVSAVASSPNPISYANDISLVTGPVHECLGNSDADWGQGLIALKDFQDREGGTVILARLLGMTPPEAYGLRVLRWRAYPSPPCRYIAVGASVLHRDPARDPRMRHFRGLRPVAVVCGSVLVFDTKDPAVWRAYELGLAEHRALAEMPSLPDDQSR